MPLCYTPQFLNHLKKVSETEITSNMWGDRALPNDLPVTKEGFLNNLLVTFSRLWLKNLRSLLPFMFRFSIPHGPKVSWYILVRIPKLALTSCPHMNATVFGTKLIMELMVSMKSVCSTSSTGLCTEATNNMMCNCTFLSYWSSRGKISFAPINIPTNGESLGVVIGCF